MSVESLLNNLNLSPKPEGKDYLVTCPACSKELHCGVDKEVGIWKCFVCGASGNPYQLVKHYRPDATPKEIMTLLSEFGLADGTRTERPPAKPKDLSWLRDKLRKPAASEIARVCKAKGIAAEALLSFSPYVHVKDPIMFLPGRKPGQARAVGFLRVHLDGELIKTKQGPQKYPMLGNWGLMGLAVAEASDSIVFAEGWRDALAAIEAGFVAIANTGGTGWKDEWLPLFKGKIVYIVPDADKPGMECAQKRAVAISRVAKEVRIVTLPYKMTPTGGKDLWDFLNEK